MKTFDSPLSSYIRYFFLWGLCSAALMSCASRPDYQRPSIDLPSQYEKKPDSSGFTLSLSSTLTPSQWWKQWNDPALNQLIETALTHNSDINQAWSRVEQMQAFTDEVSSAQFPQAQMGSGVSRYKNSEKTAPLASSVTNTGNIALSAAFQIDLWGKLRHASEAARAQTLATRYAHEVIQQMIISQVAQYYWQWVCIDQQIERARLIVNAQAENRHLYNRLFDEGMLSGLELQEAKMSYAEASLTLKSLEEQQAFTLSQLMLLTGMPASQTLPRSSTLGSSISLPSTGLPSELLERRPDIQQAEQQLIAANAYIGVKNAERFPSLSLTGKGGWESTELTDFISRSSRFGMVGLSVDTALFDAGYRAASLEKAKAQLKEAQSSYQKTVLSAFKDVSDALIYLRTVESSKIDAQAKENASIESFNIVNQREKAGYASRVEWLNAQQKVWATQIQSIATEQSHLMGIIRLYLSLGGDWDQAKKPLN